MNSIRLILVLTTISVTATLFTNCDHTENSKGIAISQTDLQNGGAYNGGGHSGKLTYLNVNLSNNCDSDPVRGLTFDNNVAHSFTYECGGEVQTTFDPSQFFAVNYNPYIVVYNERIYAEENFLGLLKNEHAVVEAYCYNTTYEDPDLHTVGLDFTVKRTLLRSKNGPTRTTTGYLFFGRGSLSAPLVQSESGHLSDPNASGASEFTSTSNHFTVNFAPHINPTRTLGTVAIKSTGQNIPVECYMYSPDKKD